LVDRGRSVIVIEQNRDVEGPPADLCRAPGSVTGEYLRSRLP